MKITLLIAVALLLAYGSRSQETPKYPIDPDTKLITYKEVVQVPGNQEQLFVRAIEWVNKQYKSPMEVTKVRNPATGIIDIVHRIEITKEENGVVHIAGTVDYFMKLELKEGRYRYTITNFTSRDVSRKPIEVWMDKSNKAYTSDWDNNLQQVDDSIKKLIESLKQAMLPPVPKKVDSW